MNIIVRKKTCEFLGILNKIVFTLFFSISSVFLGCQVSYGCSFTHDDLSDEEDKVAPFEKKQAFQSWGAVFDDESGKVTLPIKADHLQSLEDLLTNHEEILDFYDPYVTLESSPNARMFQTFTKFKKLSGLKMVRGQELTIQEAETIGKIMKLFPSSLEEIDFRGTGQWLRAPTGHSYIENRYYYAVREKIDSVIQPLLNIENCLPFFEALKIMQSLKTLRIHHLDLNTGQTSSNAKYGLFNDSLNSLEKLETLDLSHINAGGLCFAKISNGIKHLVLKGLISYLYLLNTIELNSLESLDISFSSLSDYERNYNPRNYHFLTKVPNLKTFVSSHKFSKSPMSCDLPFRNKKGSTYGFFLDTIPYYSNITKIDLSHNKVTSEGLKSIQFIENLTYLDVSHNDLDDWATSLLYFLPLEHLDISYNTAITEKSFGHVERFPKSLQFLKVCGNHLKWSVVFNIIEKIEERPNQPKVIGFRKRERKKDPFLRFMRNGESVPDHIDLINEKEGFPYSEHEEIGEAGERLLQKKLQGKKGLKTLKLKKVHSPSLIESIEDKSSLTSFGFQDNVHSSIWSALKGAPIRVIITNCFKNPNINIEDLTYLEINNNYMHHFSLEPFKNLETLITKNGRYTFEKSYDFITAIRQHPTLTEVNLSGADGIGTNILNLLSCPNNLKKLNIYNPKIKKIKTFGSGKHSYQREGYYDYSLSPWSLSSVLISFLDSANKNGSKLTHLDVGGVDVSTCHQFDWKVFNSKLEQNRTLKHLGLVDMFSEEYLKNSYGYCEENDFWKAVYLSRIESVDFREQISNNLSIYIKMAMYFRYDKLSYRNNIGNWCSVYRRPIIYTGGLLYSSPDFKNNSLNPKDKTNLDSCNSHFCVSSEIRYMGHKDGVNYVIKKEDLYWMRQSYSDCTCLLSLKEL